MNKNSKNTVIWPFLIVWQKHLNKLIDLIKIDPSDYVLMAWFAGICLPLTQSSFSNLTLLSMSIICIGSVAYIKKQLIYYCLISLTIGTAWASYSFQSHSESILPTDLQQIDLHIKGTVVDLPRRNQDNVQFIFQIDESSKDRRIEGKLLNLSCYRCPFDITPNQRWALTVRLKQPHGYASWGAFDYEKYLFRRQIIAKGYLRLKQHNLLLSESAFAIDRLRWQIAQRLTSLDDTKSVGYAVISALTIGDKSQLTKAQKNTFQTTGLSHLMAISGLHVGLVFGFICLLSTWCLFPVASIYNTIPRQTIVLIPALCGAFFYAALAGFSASTQRAFIMLCVFVICRLFARQVNLFKVLLVSIGLILLIDPFSILDTGFWLSCGAVLIIAIASLRKDKLSLVSLQFKLWFGMLPMGTLFFSQVSFISPIVNLFAVPVFCLALIPLTLVGMIMLLFGSTWLLNLLNQIFSYIYQLLTWLADLPFSHWYTLQWSWLHILLTLMFLLLMLIASRARYIAAGFLLVSLFFKTPSFIKDNDLRVTLIDVGQGLSMLVQIDDYVLLYDTGPRYLSGFTAAQAVIVPLLRTHGIKKIDRLIISHADNDHIGGYQVIAEAYPVTDVLTSRVDKLPDAKECQAGQSWSVREVKFEIISPDSNTPKGSNNLSCVLTISYGDNRVLITGDIEKQVERYLVQRHTKKNDQLSANIMLVPHQGSKTSSTDAFIDLVEPDLVLIAAGYLNHYGHPHPSVLARYQSRGVNVVSTIDQGSILLKINKQAWHKAAYRVVQRRFWHHQKKPN